MTRMTTVWAFAPLQALHNQTGFVQCDADLAADLIESGQVQDPRIGVSSLKHVTAEAPAKAAAKRKYSTKVLTPEAE